MKCPTCDGTGKQKRSMLVGDKMTTWYSPVAKCNVCKGTGITEKIAEVLK